MTRSFRRQATFFRRQFLQGGGLPFTDILTDEAITQALAAVGGWLDRVFSPLVTPWVFLGQVLSADHSCRAAVARLIAHRVARGQRPCSAHTGAYCQARKRLPERFVADVARRTGRELDARAAPEWRWEGRRVYVYDGSSVTMPDTPANQAAYPRPSGRASGSPWPGSRPSSPWPAGRSSSWASAGTRVRGRASWGCSAPCGTCSARGTSCWPTGCSARGPSW